MMQKLRIAFKHGSEVKFKNFKKFQTLEKLRKNFGKTLENNFGKTSEKLRKNLKNFGKTSEKL
jgi:hypothetical protein